MKIETYGKQTLRQRFRQLLSKNLNEGKWINLKYQVPLSGLDTNEEEN